MHDLQDQAEEARALRQLAYTFMYRDGMYDAKSSSGGEHRFCFEMGRMNDECIHRLLWRRRIGNQMIGEEVDK